MPTYGSVVTERTVQRETLASRNARRGRRPQNQPEPIMESVSFRTWHGNPDCTWVSQGEIVARDVAPDADGVGLPCDYCSTVPDSQPVDVAEIAAEADERRRAARPNGFRQGRGTPVDNSPTERQVAFLTSLLRDGGVDDPENVVRVIREGLERQGQWTKRKVSELIDAAKTDNANARAAQPAAAPADGRVGTRPNRYAGTCRLCNGAVDVGAGLLGKLNGRWVVEHKPGECVAPAQQPTTPLPDVPAGHYAIPSTGDNDLAFYRVDRPTEGRWAGRVFVKLVVGGHPDSNVPRDHIAGILQRIADDPDAGPRYGREIGRCCVCNRTLTDDESRALGIGPVCRNGGGGHD